MYCQINTVEVGDVEVVNCIFSYYYHLVLLHSGEESFLRHFFVQVFSGLSFGKNENKSIFGKPNW